ncbi:MAG TPA: VWA domain-containing protein, partial [Pyrinomonadaceae bacterium]|nr:VWA domain-containing protein [Pyrinomonadaceae bacterium]
FIDDFHLSGGGVKRIRETIAQFIDSSLQPGDQVAITSATGQIGFLQQFTDHPGVLRAALARINHRPYTVKDVESIPMTEYQALKIDSGDKDALDYFADQWIRENVSRKTFDVGPPPGGPANAPRGGNAASIQRMVRMSAESNVKQRAQLLLKQSSDVTKSTLDGLASLTRIAAGRPGRKLGFFVSDGFLLNDRETGAVNLLKQITDTATRAGVIFYTIDTQGLSLGASGVDASSNRFDTKGQLSRANIGERSTYQDPLTALAGDTGGKAFLNSDSFDLALADALKETAGYYVLAWRPASEGQKLEKSRKVEVQIVNHPEFKIRLPKADFMADLGRGGRKDGAVAVAEKSNAKSAIGNATEADLPRALSAAHPAAEIPAFLSLSYIDTPNNGPVLTAALQVSADGLDYGAGAKEKAQLDIAGVVLDDRGATDASFKVGMNVDPASAATRDAGVIYNYRTPIKPGLRQVRAAVRDSRSGRVGSVTQWIEIPDLAARQLKLSSLLLGGQQIGAAGGQRGDAPVQFSVTHRFGRAKPLVYWVFVYNAVPNKPDVRVEARIKSGRRLLLNSPPARLRVEGQDPARLLHVGELDLKTLPVGRYTLEVAVIDGGNNSRASENASIVIE